MSPDVHYFQPEWVEHDPRRLEVDACVYGASAAGVVAAITLADRGQRVALLQPGGFVGGMTTGGLGWTDLGQREAIGGAALAFYRALGAYYRKDIEPQFEPSAAMTIFEQELSRAGVMPLFHRYLDGVDVQGGTITAAHFLGGLTVSARIFIDATYEGDLLAAAGVPYRVGRESNDVFGETLNGIQVRDGVDHFNRDHHQFNGPVSPYVTENDPTSGLLPGILDEDLRERRGQGDHRVQAYNFRVCMTDDPDLRVDWQKPDGYDPADYVLLERWLRSEKDEFNEQVPAQDGDMTRPRKFDKLPNPTPGGYHKTDTNNHGAVSSDLIGGSDDWPEATYEQREAIFQKHVRWQSGMYYHIANAPGIPEKYRRAYRRWGLARDEFPDTGHWPHQLYVREARRMSADHVITEHDCTHRTQVDDPIGLASYTMDSHNTTRFVVGQGADARVMNEGNVEVMPSRPFGVGYRSVIPPAGSVKNLLVPICLSASHIAYGSVRMEPVFMILGQSVGIAASMLLGRSSIDTHCLSYAELRPELLKAGQVLETSETRTWAKPVVSHLFRASASLTRQT
ncbi:MAG: FAD-dependent oxidoreductase [Planctomycetota bacterium]